MPHTHCPPDPKDLLQWLAQHGMRPPLVTVQRISGAGRGLVTTKHVQARAPLFTLPESALLNIRTLRPLYPDLFTSGKNMSSLSATQFISLHLFLHYPHNGVSDDVAFGPYISSLPTDFNFHPLTWRVLSSPGSTALLEALPMPIFEDLEAVHKRLVDDWEAVASFLRRPERTSLVLTLRENRTDFSISSACPSEFLWAWLCVNTRSVFYQLGDSRSSSDNITLCPLLDFANHSHVTNIGTSVPTFYAPTDLAVGTEVHLNYGAHPDSKLFVEYGFVTGGDEQAQLDVGPELKTLFKRDPLSEAKTRLLKDAGYWDEWTLHLTPTPHPSFRTMSAIRCLHLDHVHRFSLWESTIQGLSEVVDAENEHQSRVSVEALCLTIAEAATQRSDDLAHWEVGSHSASTNTVRQLWDERRRIAQGVLAACRRGDEF